MAITYETEGVVEATTASSRSYTLPTGIVAGDLIVILVGMKPSAANTGDVGPVSGYTEVTPQVFGGGYGATLGVDTGNTLIAAFARVADGTEGTTRTVPFTGQNIVWVWGARLSNATGLWDVAGATGEDTTAGSVSVTFTSDPGVEGGDYVIAAMCIPTDVTTPSQFSAEALSQTGVTYGTVTEVAEPDSSGGNDIGGFIVRAPVSSGTSSAAPALTATAGGTTTNVRGPAIIVRAREVSAGGPTLVDVLQASEADAAQLVARVKLRTVGQAVEVDAGQPVARVKRRTVGQVVESDAAQQVARRKVRAAGQAVEVDTAQPITARSALQVPVGQVVETDSAQTVGRRKARGAGQALEADAAQPVGRVKRRTLGVVAETDTAAAIARRKARTAGLAAETDAGQPLGRRKLRGAATGLETDAAQPIARRKLRGVGQALEADTALPVTSVGTISAAVGTVVEVDVAGTVSRVKVRGVAQAVSTQSAQPIGRRRLRTVAAAAELSTAHPVAGRKVVTLGTALEVDVAQPVAAVLVAPATTSRARMVGASTATPSAVTAAASQTGPGAVMVSASGPRMTGV